MNATPAKRTPLYDRHVAHGGRLVPFAGWELPVQYSGLIDEHMAVRKRAGLFDVSHMGEARVGGPQACDFLQHLTCNNVARLKTGRAHYNGLMTPSGCFHDDLLIYRLDGQQFLLVLNAANVDKDLAWMRDHLSGFDVELTDESERWALLALQGPRALAILEPLTRDPVAGLPYYGFARTPVAGVETLVSRTGYTGEDGFELYVPSEGAGRVWDALIEGGGEHGLKPAGLGARDTLRLEAKMALYGNDIDDTTTALEADLGWIVKFKKGDFIGREALARQKAEGLTRRLVGFEMEGRAIARHGYEARIDGRIVGRVTSGTLAPYLDKRIGLAYLPLEHCDVGTSFEVQVRGTGQPARVCETPFYKRDRP
ncbi:MAG: glycine cleavage system aminomethyltransferase GcvT [Acidobacteria bacterium]|nr:glycine cleavage system aminomethyltransferase GcvT [Acidobacteriota bacterium]NIM60538.1 glycine cleavage system aminomethyltransferase GcvT [Acidobacteriota bacterium]NIO59509.1 glycine cleavage system aminomethyltransferase GcvT [Acidobacteriota bacterium]NIQ30538.1 glycine cleavage system aminomethyltransferase GcvT [Acidobacteriota bacterium]NIQ85486.1 glycine cleavage system aminomethyltransferase GcvT [Acidobacteriota bacterium]